jgi:hypothetical protein
VEWALSVQKGKEEERSGEGEVGEASEGEACDLMAAMVEKEKRGG